MCICIYMYIYIRMNVCICACICMCIYIYIRVCICVCVCISLSLYIYIYIYIYWSRYVGTSGRTGPGPRQALWCAAKSISGQHSYICMYTTSGGRSRGKIVSSLRKHFGARQRNPLNDYPYVYICVYIYTHTLVVTVLCEILSICCIFYTTKIFVRLLEVTPTFMR